MSSNIKLILITTCQHFSISATSVTDIISYIKTDWKIPIFTLISSNGLKYSKTNPSNINQLLINNPDTNILYFLIIPCNYIATERKKENTLQFDKLIIKIRNQVQIKLILNNFFENIIARINSKIIPWIKLKDKYWLYKSKLSEEYWVTFNRFKELFSRQNNIDFSKIDSAVTDFTKTYNLYQSELEKLILLSQEYLDLLRDNIKQIILDSTKSCNGLEQVDWWKQYNDNNETLIRIVDIENGKKKSWWMEKFSVVNWYKRQLEELFNIVDLPAQFLLNVKEIKKEIENRKLFDSVYQLLMGFIQGKWIVGEEKRRKNFEQSIRIHEKNELFLKFINFFYEAVKGNSEGSNMNILSNPMYNKLEGFNEQKKKDIYCENQALFSNLNKINTLLFDHDVYSSCIMSTLSRPIINQSSRPNTEDTHADTIKEELTKILNENFNIKPETNETIMEMLQIIKNKTKWYSSTNEAILDISNTSLACSILLDNKDVNNIPYNTCTWNLRRNQSSGSASGNNVNKTVVIKEIEKTVWKFEEKLYFYDTLFDYIHEYMIKTNHKGKEKINKMNPTTWVEAIEEIVKENSLVKSKYNKLHSKLNLLKTA